MNEYRIRITRQARDHLREIRKYIECELLAPVAAKKFFFPPGSLPRRTAAFPPKQKNPAIPAGFSVFFCPSLSVFSVFAL